jgi:hypothetical protein
METNFKALGSPWSKSTSSLTEPCRTVTVERKPFQARRKLEFDDDSAIKNSDHHRFLETAWAA